MAQTEIPKPWRDRVCAILATERTGSQIRWTRDATTRYEADAAAVKLRSGDNDPVWHNEIYQPLKEFLSNGHPTGCSIMMHDPPGDTYEFLFHYKGERFYGKILLFKDNKRIIIFSAHLANYDRLSCD
jgi:hypothetical protein